MAQTTITRLAVLGGVAALAAAGNAVTVATFVDPALDGSQPLFQFNPSQGLSGSWDSLGLNLVLPVSGTTVTDAKFAMSTLPIVGQRNLGYTSVIYLGPGSLVFRGQNDEEVLRAEFGGATLYNPYGAGVADLVGHDVRYTGQALFGDLSGDQFSFSFANRRYENNLVSFTGSLTAQAVPEPVTIGLAGLGVLAAARMRRSRKR